MSTPLIIGNWKMNKTIAESIGFVQEIGEELNRLHGVEAVLCPSFLSLPVLEGLLRGTSVRLGSQDVAAWKSGAYTGEVAAAMLKGHCQFVIVGHSERRRFLLETPALINSKIRRCTEAGLQPVVCVSNESEVEALAEVKSAVPDWIVAYEPLEAIGTGQTADVADVASQVNVIRHHLGKKTRVLYGGSVDDTNIRKYLGVSDGALVGGASLDPQIFLRMCQKARR